MACCLLFIRPAAPAQEEPPIRYRHGSEFSRALASFVSWPEKCVFRYSRARTSLSVRRRDFGNSLQELTKDVKPKGRHVEVRFRKTPDQIRACHILFIGRDDAKKYGAIL